MSNIKTNENISEDGKSWCFIKTENMKEIVKESLANEYNRTITLDTVNNFVNDICLVFLTMVHEHKKGLPVDPHYRICFYASEGISTSTYVLDTDIETFEKYAEYKEV